jgi:hypothetical protein
VFLPHLGEFFLLCPGQNMHINSTSELSFLSHDVDVDGGFSVRHIIFNLDALLTTTWSWGTVCPLFMYETVLVGDIKIKEDKAYCSSRGDCM